MKLLISLVLSGLALMPITAYSQTDVEKELEAIKKRLEKAEKKLEEKESTSRTGIASYAEVHYNNLDNKLAGGSDKKEIDVHRAIIEVEHHFTDDVRAEVELEVEHAYVTDSGTNEGELEVEQAFVEFKNETRIVKLGQFILPVGILNKKHKPTDFYGVERNNVENKIIPTTWWEAGVLYQHKFSKNLSVDAIISSGFKTSAASTYAVRSGRQKGSKAQADDLAYLATLKWKINENVKVGASLQHQTDITQGTDTTAGSANLLTAHVIWNMDAVSVTALYATWDLDGSGPAAVGADEQTGWYVEPAYRINKEFGVFARYSTWDNQAGNATDTEYSQMDIGVNYWPMKNIVIKADYQDQDSPAGENEFDGINLGMGFKF